jgi:hypothetical protein
MDRNYTSENKTDSALKQAAKPNIDTKIKNPIIQMQRHIGNQAIQKILQSKVMQTKLSVSEPGDKYEQEADHVADQVMRMPDSQVQQATEEEEKKLQTKVITPFSIMQRTPLIDDEEKPLQAKETSTSTFQVDSGTESSINNMHGSGQPLSASDRDYFEPRFGYDFSNVKVHTDPQAAELAQAVNAKAFTLGQDVVFGAGQYAPESEDGKWLIAHELTHVVQQGSDLVRRMHNTQIQCTPDEIEFNNRNPSASPETVMRKSLLNEETQETKQKLTFDTDAISRELNKYFDLTGSVKLAKNVNSDYSYAIDSIDNIPDDKTKANLKKGLSLYALGIFDLLPDDKKDEVHSNRLNLVHVENIDLSRWGGPNESFRFTCIGQTGKANTINVRILIESEGLSSKYMSDDVTAPGIEQTVSKYGIRRDSSNDPLAPAGTISDDVWKKILCSLGRIGEWILMRLRDITFVASSKNKSPKGESAEYWSESKNGVITRKIILYADLLSSNDRDFAFTIQHEIGHALDYAPAESPVAIENNKLGHNDPKFLEAVKADGGRAGAITEYGKTNDLEFYAECFAMFISQPSTLMSIRPKIYDYFNKYQWEALKDPKLNPYAPKPGEKSQMPGLGPGFGLF